MTHEEPKPYYATKFGWVGVSGTPSTGKCGAAGTCAGKPAGVRDAEPPTDISYMGAGSIASLDVVLEHLYGIVEDIAVLRDEIAAIRKALKPSHSEPDYMVEDFNPR